MIGFKQKTGCRGDNRLSTDWESNVNFQGIHWEAHDTARNYAKPCLVGLLSKKKLYMKESLVLGSCIEQNKTSLSLCVAYLTSSTYSLTGQWQWQQNTARHGNHRQPQKWQWKSTQDVEKTSDERGKLPSRTYRKNCLAYYATAGRLNINWYLQRITLPK